MTLPNPSRPITPPLGTASLTLWPAKWGPCLTLHSSKALRLAREALHTGTCERVRIYACDTVALAKSADISVVRSGERLEIAL